MARDLGAVAAEDLLHRAGNFADGRLGAGGFHRERQQVAAAGRRVGERGKRRLHRRRIALGPEPLQLLDLVRAHRRIVDLQHLDRRFVVQPDIC